MSRSKLYRRGVREQMDIGGYVLREATTGGPTRAHEPISMKWGAARTEYLVMTHYAGRGSTDCWSEEEIDRTYHRFPKDDAWKKCTLAAVIEEGSRLWLYCTGCQHSSNLDAKDFADRHRLDVATAYSIMRSRNRSSLGSNEIVALLSSAQTHSEEN